MITPQEIVAILLEAVVRRPRSVLIKPFKKMYENIPAIVKMQATKKYRRWRKNPESLNFEPKYSNIYGIELTGGYHAICRVEDEMVTWLFIGNYKDYDAFLKR